MTYIIKKQMYGSREICNPPPRNTDEDWIVLTKHPKELEDELLDCGFEHDTKEVYKGKYFTSYRKGHFNYVVTDSDLFYDATVEATAIAKKLNIRSKIDRKELFMIVKRAYGLEGWA